MTKDRRYTTAKNLILGGYMKAINELFDIIPKSTVARDLGTNLSRLNKMIADTQYFTFRDMVRIAALLEVDEMAILDLAYRQYIDNKKSKRKK